MLVNLNNKDCLLNDFGVSYPYKVQNFMGGGLQLELENYPTIALSFLFDDRSGLPLFIIGDVKIPVLSLTLHLSGNDEKYFKILESGVQLKLDLCYTDKS
jgi:hypothetical protein